MDHGILNVPLSKRGNIDAQIDAYKAKQAAEAEAKRKEAVKANRALKAEAKAVLSALLANDELIVAKAEKLGVTHSKLVATLTDWSKWSPARLLKLHVQWTAA